MVQGFNLNDYSYEDIWLTVEEISYTPNPLHDVYGAHCLSLVHSFQVCELDYARCMLTVTLSSVVSLDGTMLTKAFDKSAWRRVLEQNCKMVVFTKKYRRQTTLRLQLNNGLHRSREGIHF